MACWKQDRIRKKEAPKRSIQSTPRLFMGTLLLELLSAAALPALPPAPAAQEIPEAFVAHPSPEGMTGETLFAKLLERNREREARLLQYSGSRTYRVKNDKDRVRAETQVRMQYRAPATKAFQIVSERGSGTVRRRVFQPLLESEVETAAGRNRHDSEIIPDNYYFELLGEDDAEGYHCFLVQAIPKRRDKYLFEGRIWIEAHEFAIVKTAGRPAKNLSFWTKRVDFVRRYQKIGDFWLPQKDESITQVRIFGKHRFTIDYDQYEIVPVARADQEPRARASSEWATGLSN
ncbi:MAG: hypothetical protein HYR55_13145 [Acidobacteria bacterium]|nr:hypothetical protein [Acidobacteriota bacterium]